MMSQAPKEILLVRSKVSERKKDARNRSRKQGGVLGSYGVCLTYLCSNSGSGKKMAKRFPYEACLQND